MVNLIFVTKIDNFFNFRNLFAISNPNDTFHRYQIMKALRQYHQRLQ